MVIFMGENSEQIFCSLEDRLVIISSPTLINFNGDPRMKKLTEIIYRVVEAGIYKHWISISMHYYKLSSWKIATIFPHDGYYSFNLYHI